jgi:hypothetical protein
VEWPLDSKEQRAKPTNNMFDLEKSIAEWRQQMRAAGIKTPVPLEELEIHLREDIAQQMQSGLSAQQAFEIAVKKVGRASELKKEFKKIGDSLETRLVKSMGAACVAVAFVFSLWISLFLFEHDTGLTAKALGLAAFAVTALGWKYNHKFLPVVRNHWHRAAIGFAGCIGCLIWIQFFILDFVPQMLIHPGSVLHQGLMMAGFLWGWTVMAILGGVGFGLERAARKSTTA